MLGRCVARLRRLIGCLKLQFIFSKRATNYRPLLRKITYTDNTSYGSSPPCISSSSHFEYPCYWITAWWWLLLLILGTVFLDPWLRVYVAQIHIYLRMCGLSLRFNTHAHTQTCAVSSSANDNDTSVNRYPCIITGHCKISGSEKKIKRIQLES